MGAKSDNAEIEKRVTEILRIRIDGAQYHDVVQYAAEKGWDVRERQLREYMARADNLLVERLEKDQAKLIAKHTARREALYARAVNAADHRTALAILDSMAKLQGLIVDRVKVDREQPPVDLSRLTNVQLDLIIATLGPVCDTAPAPGGPAGALPPAVPPPVVPGVPAAPLPG